MGNVLRQLDDDEEGKQEMKQLRINVSMMGGDRLHILQYLLGVMQETLCFLSFFMLVNYDDSIS